MAVTWKGPSFFEGRVLAKLVGISAVLSVIDIPLGELRRSLYVAKVMSLTTLEFCAKVERARMLEIWWQGYGL